MRSTAPCGRRPGSGWGWPGEAGRDPRRRRCKHSLSALLRPGNRFIGTLTSGGHFYVSEAVLAEIFRHKEKIVSTTHLNQDELAGAYHAILRIVEIFREGLIPAACWEQAAELCRGVDLNDTPPVALTLALDGLLWTGDKALKAGLMAKGFDRFFTP